MNPIRYLNQAAHFARKNRDMRTFFIGAVAIRGDKAVVSANNGSQKYPTPQHHCEARLSRKLDRNAVVFVARVLANGEWAMSKPCADCERALRRMYVKRVYYTIGPNEYGVIEFK